jgi:hypothetical protein
LPPMESGVGPHTLEKKTFNGLSCKLSMVFHATTTVLQEATC